MAGWLTRSVRNSIWKWISTKPSIEHFRYKSTYTTVAQPLPDQSSSPAKPSVDISGVRVLLFCDKENSLTKLVKLSLRERGVQAMVHEYSTAGDMVDKSRTLPHDIIICPFLTKRVPEEVWSNKEKPCLIVHPGIPGDRGMSSLDWAILEKRRTWGVTVLQAAEEMDAGDIWSTDDFLVDDAATKSDLYSAKVAAAATDAVLDAVERFTLKIPPQPLDYNNIFIKGTLKSNMKVKDRRVDWEMAAGDVARRVRMSDTQPGSRGTLVNLGLETVMFGAHAQGRGETQEVANMLDGGQAGDVVGQKDGAVLVKAGDGNGVWITHMKRGPGKHHLKLPSISALPPDVSQHLQVVMGRSSWAEISTRRLCGDPRLAMVHFDFYNGAMSTDQCQRLRKEIENVSQDPEVKVVLLLGGPRFFSNGIHLNMIEAADDPIEESWQNINAIDDVIASFASIQDKVIVSALQGPAGAGGVMMAAAADLVWARQGILVTPTYKSMNLFGSEYWTYFLPRRVGPVVAEKMTNSTESILVQTAESIGLIDKTFGRDSEEFLDLLPTHLFDLVDSDSLEQLLEEKWAWGPERMERLAIHRSIELNHMKKCFRSQAYHDARKAFVYH